MSTIQFRNRIRKLQAELGAQAPAALLISSSSSKIRNRDTSYSYRQDSDFYYLTGILDHGFTLLVSSALKRPVLFTTPPDPHRILWEGAGVAPSKLAAAFGADVCISKDIRIEVRKRLAGIETLFFQNAPNTIGFEVASELFGNPSHRRGNFPVRFIHTDALIAPLRLIKDKGEIEAIRRSGQITNSALFGALSLIQPGATEHEIAGVIQFYFRAANATSAFNSIIASGASAATLHYEKLNKTLKRGELLLLDVGAEHNMYAGDITRVVPVDGRFTPEQRDLYHVVLQSQKAAIKAARHGVLISKVHEAAARVLTEGLVDLKVLRGKVSKLLVNQSYKPFFPHGIGHTLGIDVHDIGTPRATGPLVLKKGMVITIEPGLYFAKRTGKIPPCGIRIEDDILITGGSAEILSEGFPKEVHEIEALF